MKKNNAFTLIEMLVVIVILGVILAIAIPNVTGLISGKSSKLYNQQIKLIDSAVRGYTLEYKSELIDSGDNSCYILPYEKLLRYELLIESEITCSGNIVLNKENNDYTYDYYLTCKDKDGTKFSEAKNLPTGCTIIQ